MQDVLYPRVLLSGAFVTDLLGGCNFSAEKPLLDDAPGRKVLGERVTAGAFDAAGRPRIFEDGMSKDWLCRAGSGYEKMMPQPWPHFALPRKKDTTGPPLRWASCLHAARGQNATIAQTLACGPAAERMSQGILIVVRAAREASRYVPSCAPHHTESKCKCLAGLLRGQFPAIDQSHYSRAVMDDTVGSNPTLGITAGLACGISRY